MGRFAVAAIGVLALLAGCGDEGTTNASEESQANTPVDGLAASCGGVHFDGVPADPSAFPSAEAVWSEIDLGEIGMEAEFFDRYDWSVATQSDQELHLFGSPISSESEEGPQFASASFEREADGWSPTSWGQCRIQLTAPGFGPARFVLDPDREPDPQGSTIAVQATEMACTGGEAPEGRDVESVVLTQDEHSVSIVVLVEPPDGDQTCPGNPSFPLEIDLDDPLGGRQVFDASTQPPLARPWPPTKSSLESTGLEE